MWWKDLQGGEALAVTGRATMIENLGALLSGCPGTAYLCGVDLDAIEQPDIRDLIAAAEHSAGVVMIPIRPTRASILRAPERPSR